jgi:hypothetical protein
MLLHDKSKEDLPVLLHGTVTVIGSNYPSISLDDEGFLDHGKR